MVFVPLLHITYLCLQVPLDSDCIFTISISNLMALWTRKHPVHDEQLRLHDNFVAHG